MIEFPKPHRNNVKRKQRQMELVNNDKFLMGELKHLKQNTFI